MPRRDGHKKFLNTKEKVILPKEKPIIYDYYSQFLYNFIENNEEFHYLKRQEFKPGFLVTRKRGVNNFRRNQNRNKYENNRPRGSRDLRMGDRRNDRRNISEKSQNYGKPRPISRDQKNDRTG